MNKLERYLHRRLKLNKYRQVIKECPKCGLQSNNFGLKRFHFDNCTERPIVCRETQEMYANSIEAAKSVTGYNSSLGNKANLIRQCAKGVRLSAFKLHWGFEEEIL